MFRKFSFLNNNNEIEHNNPRQIHSARFFNESLDEDRKNFMTNIILNEIQNQIKQIENEKV